MIMPVIKWLLSNELFNLGLLPSEPTGTMTTLLVTMSPVPTTGAGPWYTFGELMKIYSV